MFNSNSFWGYLYPGDDVMSLRRFAAKTSSEPSNINCDVVMVLSASGNGDNLLALGGGGNFSRADMSELAEWIVEQLKKFAPELRADIHFHRVTNSYAIYISVSHIGLLKGAELCCLKKKLKARYGGTLRDFTYDEAQYFEGAECADDDAFFLSSIERAVIVKRILCMIRSPKGGLRFEPNATASRKLLYDDAVNDSSTKSTHKDSAVMSIQIMEGRTFVSTLSALGVIATLFPLHEHAELAALKREWFNAETHTMLLVRQPLDAIKQYFGAEIALYFAWLEHFTVALCIPALLGIFFFFFGDAKFLQDNSKSFHNTWYSDVCFVLFALANCIWATAYLELWKRRQAELAFQWGNLELASDDPLMDDTRPEFKGDRMTRNPVSGSVEPQYAEWKHVLVRYGVTYPVTILCIIIVFAFLFCMLRLQDAMELYLHSSSWVARCIVYLPMVTQAIVIFVADFFYRYLALIFNDLENYRTDKEFESFLITKIAIFQCVNAFAPLFYIAFYLGDMRRLQETLATLLITRQLLQNLVELAAPLFKERIRLVQFNNAFARLTRSKTLRHALNKFQNRSFRRKPLGAKIFEKVEFLKKKNVGRKRVDDGDDDEQPRHRRTAAAAQQQNSSFRSSDEMPLLDDASVEENDNCETILTDVELQSVMTDYIRPLDDYLEIFIQFGYVLLFSPAFPLAAACALVNNLFEMRVDAFKLCYTLQRPFARRVKTIGAWQDAMQLMGIVGVFVNCALIAQYGVLARLFPNMSGGAQFFLIVLVEHLIFALKFIIDAAIPDVPHWVRVETAKFEYYRREAYKRDTKLQKSAPQPKETTL